MQERIRTNVGKGSCVLLVHNTNSSFMYMYTDPLLLQMTIDHKRRIETLEATVEKLMKTVEHCVTIWTTPTIRARTITCYGIKMQHLRQLLNSRNGNQCHFWPCRYLHICSSCQEPHPASSCKYARPPPTKQPCLEHRPPCKPWTTTTCPLPSLVTGLVYRSYAAA